MAKDVIASTCDLWVKDLTELSDLVHTWIPEGWEAKKNDILEPGSTPPHDSLRRTQVTNQLETEPAR